MQAGWDRKREAVCWEYRTSRKPGKYREDEELIMAILTDIRWNLRFVLICISLMIKNIEQFPQVSFSHLRFTDYL